MAKVNFMLHSWSMLSLYLLVSEPAYISVRGSGFIPPVTNSFFSPVASICLPPLDVVWSSAHTLTENSMMSDKQKRLLIQPRNSTHHRRMCFAQSYAAWGASIGATTHDPPNSRQ